MKHTRYIDQRVLDALQNSSHLIKNTPGAEEILKKLGIQWKKKKNQ